MFNNRFKVFLALKIRKSALLGHFNIEKMIKIFVLLILFLLSTLFLFTTLFQDFKIVDGIIKLIEIIKKRGLVILLKY